ncbi:conserved hypothetical protein [Chloroherpeton thalassium ATCC 35110]|uniref:Sigma 54 modulation protein/ribosomal protein S30EA n=1 Tax=Chloroherpeton thalassium (strain ATCC 35110 / GB-78) TaxID=517418 RepID=B3QW75_CHLT3|nr:HPF/RaiA family ribosome-associated protein [Chloroherpeton thalassium]ACF13188.1 conserved hypothetical protein [Chloroherpeton thalassium ATCC 35110]
MDSHQLNGKEPNVQFTLRHSSNHRDIEAYAKDAIKAFHKYYTDILDCHIILDHQKNDKEQNKIAEIKAHVPSHTFVSKEQGPTYEVAIDTCVSNICKQLKKHRDKSLGL